LQLHGALSCSLGELVLLTVLEHWLHREHGRDRSWKKNQTQNNIIF
jgi:hypothetical protein